MQKKLAFLHTVPGLVNLFNRLSQQYLPSDVEVFHIADEMLLKVVLAQGGLSPFIHRRVAEHAVAAEMAGASLLQVTCSSLSPCVDTAGPMVTMPILKIDQPMVERAVALGSTIGVVATAPTTLKPTADLVGSTAQQVGKSVVVETVLCEGAYAAMLSGDTQTHDLIVREYILDLALRTDIIILAQASMARVLDSIDPFELAVPVLTSPELALERAAGMLQSMD